MGLSSPPTPNRRDEGELARAGRKVEGLTFQIVARIIRGGDGRRGGGGEGGQGKKEEGVIPFCSGNNPSIPTRIQVCFFYDVSSPSFTSCSPPPRTSYH